MSTDRLPDITMLWCPRCKDRKPPFCALFYGIYVNPATRQAEHVSLNKLPNRVSDRQATLNTAAVRAFRAHFQSAHKVSVMRRAVTHQPDSVCAVVASEGHAALPRRST